jgi:hypothetical protein
MADLTDAERFARAKRNARARIRRKRSHRAKALTLVRCWMCCARAWRRTYTVDSVVGRKTLVRTFGRCSRVAIPAWDGMPATTCEGSMHTETERRFVLRAALAWERRGFNNASEYS